ncbi:MULTISPECIES: type III secretion system inner rod subunit SctI [Arsenophonus]|jgi:type III secretion system protein|uniref:Type III secretion system inner rod subunit SctI n=2 Tax=Arsenophonus apicola TaxID=2879119 RepID=A0ABY8P3V6_9GAMM|nr:MULTISPECIES: type III secretion system inner rod subunit SctI [Arsenophonus]UBX29430.1 type III secretion system inner rod subunit SctI [Arsenophonus apicola]WGO83864.1 type III secretion system inner rod subunit SctI [Arsenophonus apicola]
MMNINNKSNISAMTEPAEGESMTLQQVISQAYRQHYQVEQQVTDTLQTDDLSSLLAIQQTTHDYQVEMSLLSTLARKALTTVETVIKAQ